MARCRLRLVWLSLSSIVLSATALLAQPIDSATSVTRPPAYYLLRALLSLGVIVALIYGIYFGLRRLSYAAGRFPSDDQLQVLHSRHLGGGRWIYAIKAADRVLIVGGGADGLRTLTEMPAAEYEQQAAQDEIDGSPRQR